MPPGYRRLLSDRRRAHASRDDWFSGVEGIVAEVDHSTASVKVIIPALDENRLHDEWVPVLTPFVGPPGYGAVSLPAPGSEVVLFSRGNEGFSLFCLPRFNEDYTPPAEFSDGSRGLKTDTAYRLIADLLIQLLSGEQVDVDAPLIRLLSGGGESVRCEPDKIGFLGAGAVARRPLPPPATTPAETTALANAIRAALIQLGLCE